MSRYRVLSVFLPIIIVALAWITRAYGLLGESCLRVGDYPLLVRDIELARQGMLSLGPYSRFGFHHPGPLSAYLQAAAGLLFVAGDISSIRALEFGRIFINIGCLTYIACRSSVISKSLWAVPLIFSILLSLSFQANHEVPSDIWGPSTLIFPAAAFTLSAIASIRNGALDLYALIFFGSLLTQTHLGSLVIVTAAISYVFLSRVIHAQRSASGERVWRPLLFPCIFAALLFMPPLYEMIVSPNAGNVGLIANDLLSGRKTLGLQQAVPFIAHYFSLPLLPLSALSLLGVSILLGVGHFILTPVHRNTIGLSAVLLIAAILSASQIREYPHAYLLWLMYGVVAIIVSVLVAFPIERAISYLPRPMRADAILAVVLLATVALASNRFEPKPCQDLSSPVSQLRTISADLSRNARIRLQAPGLQAWRYLGLALIELRAHGYDVCIGGKAKFLAQPPDRCPRHGSQPEVSLVLVGENGTSDGDHSTEISALHLRLEPASPKRGHLGAPKNVIKPSP